jgi:hypothetical protein
MREQSTDVELAAPACLESACASLDLLQHSNRPLPDSSLVAFEEGYGVVDVAGGGVLDKRADNFVCIGFQQSMHRLLNLWHW